MAKSSTAIDLQGKTPSDAAEADAELMRLWGEINNAWDDIERQLYNAFDALLLTVDQFATHAVFYSQKSHAARRDMVEELVKVQLLMKPDIRIKIAGAIKRVKARSQDRHILAHGTWVISADLKSGTQDLARMGFQADQLQPNHPYDRIRLLRVRNEMRDTAKTLREAIEPLRIERRAEIGKRVQQPIDAMNRLNE